MVEAIVEEREPPPGVSPAGPGDPDIGAMLQLAQRLADQLLDLRGPPVHAIRLARALTLNVVDVLEGLR